MTVFVMNIIMTACCILFTVILWKDIKYLSRFM